RTGTNTVSHRARCRRKLPAFWTTFSCFDLRTVRFAMCGGSFAPRLDGSPRRDATSLTMEAMFSVTTPWLTPTGPLPPLTIATKLLAAARFALAHRFWTRGRDNARLTP